MTFLNGDYFELTIELSSSRKYDTSPMDGRVFFIFFRQGYDMFVYDLFCLPNTCFMTGRLNGCIPDGRTERMA